MSGIFAPRRDTDITRLIQENPLAFLVSQTSEGPVATSLPLLAETDGTGATVSLLGHFARRNPHVAQLKADPKALILFLGPQGYLSPHLVSDGSWAPTWNYAAVHVEAEIRFVPDENHRAITALVHHMEAGQPVPWTVAQMGPRYEKLIRNIVAFRATILRLRAVFKLGQDETVETFREIVAGLGDGELARLMTRQNPAADRR